MIRPLIALALLTATAQAQTLENRVDGLKIVGITELPTLPPKDGLIDCFHVEPATTAPGQALAAAGWVVTAELPFGEMTAISYKPPFFSGVCGQTIGRVAFFKKNQPVAILEDADEDDGLIGRIQPLGDASVRLFTYEEPYTVPLADLYTDDAGRIAVLPLPEEQQFCGGDVQVPNIYGMPFDQARDRIFRDGWRPMPPPETDGRVFRFTDIEGNESDFNLSDWSDDGIFEPALCYGYDGTYCLFRYAQPAAKLEVGVYHFDGADISRAVRTKVKCY